VKQLRIIILMALALSALTLAGCGSDSNPAAPSVSLDSTPPPAPTGLAMTLDGPTGSYLLSWQASSAPDVATYQVYRYAPDPSRDNAYVLVGQLSTTHVLIDSPTEETLEVFRVQAVDASGNHSAFSSPLSVNMMIADPLGQGIGVIGSTPGLDKDPKRILVGD
jgi:hypothetical protein